MTQRPKPAVNLDHKLGRLVDEATLRSYVMVKYWDTSMTKKDPALASLQGVASSVSGRLISASDEQIGLQVTETDKRTIQRGDIIDIAFCGEEPLTEEALKKFATG